MIHDHGLRITDFSSKFILPSTVLSHLRLPSYFSASRIVRRYSYLILSIHDVSTFLSTSLGNTIVIFLFWGDIMEDCYLSHSPLLLIVLISFLIVCMVIYMYI